MRRFTLCLLACCGFAASVSAQEDRVNREKYPDYVDPREVYEPEPRLMKFVPVKGESKSRAAMRKTAAEKLPEYWNNAETKYFPPVFNQDGGSCGSASRICYMFTHEINALRDVDGSLPENQYPSHFVWLHTSGNDGKDQFVEFIGVPNSVVYGGRTYSRLFGYQEENKNGYGWMTGYDKWMHAVGNRMLRPTFNPLTVQSEEGRLAAKAWLYNHAGDTDFKAGGLIGLGVASGGQWHRIPKTEANDAAGVTNMYYVHRWGEQTDHAVTMVGWDDRIEFDLDGNGIAGEVEKDEKGAWIIVNSWGDWCNKGFIYCPYKYAGPMSDQETGEIIGGYWTGELYHARKNFRPLRVIKVKMDYSHRSELLLQVGISSDLNATEPESITDLHHFRYAGDGNNGNSDPAPATPMLGKWADGWHEEPMEFCYDLTDFTAGFDANKPLKYFFIVTRKKDTNRGQGNVYEASLVDMEYDTEGVETPFDLGGEKFQITQEGRQLMISSVVYGSGYEPVTNLSASAGVLTWNAPKPSSYNVASYNVYKDGAKIGNTEAMTYNAGEGTEYAVTALYEDGTESAKVICSATVMQNDVAVSFENSGFVIPNVFKTHYTDCTLEFFVRPSQFYNWNCSAGPGWGTYMHHFNADGSFSCGWGANARINSTAKFTLNSWQHVAIVVKGGSMTVYRGGTKIGSVSTSSYSGLGGFGDLVFNYSASNSWQNAMYDEIRIWDHARTVQQIKGSNILVRRQEFYGDVMPQGLLAYYKGDVLMDENGIYYMRDCVGGNHARIYADTYPEVESTNKLADTNLPATITADKPEKVYAGVPVTLTATRGDGINKVWWTIPSCDMNEVPVVSPTVTFTETGKHKVTVYGMSYAGKTVSSEIEVEVSTAPSLDATFTMSKFVLPCGEHLSMNANNYVDACSYEWTLAGANVEKVYGAKAGATYDLAGEYTVTLKITSADGQTAESSQTVSVTSVAPLADFNVSEAVVLKGSPVALNSTSRYGATALEWKLDGQAQTTTITEGKAVQYWTPKYPGKYNVTLTASNSVGSNSITKDGAIIVTNDDSQNGLNFSQPNAKVTVPSPEKFTYFTFDFWANPASLSNHCWGIGDSEENLLIKVGSDGTMYVSVNGSTVKSPAGYVQTGSWNHYAITRGIGSYITFYRNGERIQRVTTGVGKGAIEGLASITLGVDGMPMNGGIDEFRFWTSCLSTFDDICNEHMDNPAAYVESDGLHVYYDFNQSGGDVVDRSGNNNTGVRSGFGPDGDAWGLSKGVFSLYFGERLADETITSVDEVLQGDPVTAGRNGVYTLSGQYVGNTVEGLPAGMYIVDGKKVAVK